MKIIEILNFFSIIGIIGEIVILLLITRELVKINFILERKALKEIEKPIKEIEKPIKLDMVGNLKGIRKIIIKYNNGEKLVVSHDYGNIVKIDDISEKIEMILYGWEERGREISFYKTEVENYDEIREILLNKEFK